jgi:hypothetical protein
VVAVGAVRPRSQNVGLHGVVNLVAVCNNGGTRWAECGHYLLRVSG